MTATEPTAELLTELVDQLLLVENLHDPRQSSGTLTTPYRLSVTTASPRPLP